MLVPTMIYFDPFSPDDMNKIIKAVKDSLQSRRKSSLTPAVVASLRRVVRKTSPEIKKLGNSELSTKVRSDKFR
jgi:predicted neutral ceramidase superfamily lipid hydrolase